jgi:hypothetical protein
VLSFRRYTEGEIEHQEGIGTMAFCEHCQGQRFDRAQVLRTLRAMRRELGHGKRRASVDHALETAIRAVRSLDIPHMGPEPDHHHGDWLH